jgi:hypothetical protein
MHRTAKVFSVAAMLLVTSWSPLGVAQKRHGPWMEMPKKEAEKLLSNSPWAQIQVDTDVSEMFYSPTKAGASSPGRSRAATGRPGSQTSINNDRADRGAVNQAVEIKYRICFLSARPVREAFAKVVLSSKQQPEDGLVQQLQSFVERDFSPYIVIAVTIDANDPRFSGPIMQQINSANAGTLKNNAYLERQDGKRLFLSDYLTPIADGLGAKFIFPRRVNDQDFLNTKSDSVRFVAEFSDTFKLNMRFKVADMIYDDKLEY